MSESHNPRTQGRHLTDESYILETTVKDRMSSLRDREKICWDMAGVFLSSKDAHGLHDMGVEIQGIQWAIRELEKFND